MQAGLELLIQSRLVDWDQVDHRLKAPPENPTAEFAKKGKFGRLISWILFSIGAEYLLKAACEAKSIAGPQSRTFKIEYPLPTEETSDWAHRVAIRPVDEAVPQGISTDSFYSTLGYYVRVHINPSADGLGLQSSEKELVFAAFKLLTVIRNRDVHTYEKDVRNANFYLVEKVFVPCLNLLWDSMPTSMRDSIQIPD